MSAKELHIEPIVARVANLFVKAHHYSGKVAANSQLHFGVFWEGKLEGVIQLGPSMVKKKSLAFVPGTGWNDFLEINRMAFSEALPRNSESRALSVVIRIIRKHYPNVKWLLSYADATQCGDGTIYRAAGFLLIGCKKNTAIYEMPTGETVARMTMTDNKARPGTPPMRVVHEISLKIGKDKDEIYKATNGSASVKKFMEAVGGRRLEGFQVKYIFFLDPAYREKLAVPVLPFSELDRLGARMYRGKRPLTSDGAGPSIHEG